MRLVMLTVVALNLLLLLNLAHSVPLRTRYPPVFTELVPGQWFDRFIIINLENSDYSTAVSDTYFSSLASQSGVLLTNYHAVAHPSQPNYVSQLFGDTYGIKNDNNINVPGENIVDRLEGKGISWKAYMENYPGGCFTKAKSSDGLYTRKHNPFISMDTIRTNADRCAKIVDASELDTDISNSDVPQYVYYTPNMDNDGHDTSPEVASSWLEQFFSTRLTDTRFVDARTLVVVTFDESENQNGDNQVWTVLLGGVVAERTGQEDAGTYGHYCLTKTLEANWGLASLGRQDDTAAVIKL